ncbi:MAG: DUF4404 family protein [Gammaproteobacteria bacterium]|nr:DUF4404 family protein [Gammaproteobacteria bacterium]
MSKQELKDSLAALRRELATLGPEAAAARTRLAALVDEVEQELEALETDADHASLMDKLQQQVEAFEVEHPRVTNILNDIMVTLSNLGI